MIYYCYYNSAFGKILLAGNNDELLKIGLPINYAIQYPAPDWQHSLDIFREIIQQLDLYFHGKLKKFNISISLNITPFQLQVLSQVKKIPFGETRSYSDIAIQIDNPNSVRAVGGANAKNPFPIIIPCHRVIGKDNSLTGFGGSTNTKIKSFLLKLEKQYA